MRALPLLFVFALGCGEADEGMHISFKMHAEVACDREGMQASLQATGVDGFCPLEVSAAREISGTCFNVPAGQERTFRLIYYFTLNRDYELAVAEKTLDLRDEKRHAIVLEFDAESLTTNRDDDGDSFTNLQEFCCGTHPGINGESCN